MVALNASVSRLQVDQGRISRELAELRSKAAAPGSTPAAPQAAVEPVDDCAILDRNVTRELGDIYLVGRVGGVKVLILTNHRRENEADNTPRPDVR
jgi:hypothetical protein